MEEITQNEQWFLDMIEELGPFEVIQLLKTLEAQELED